MVLELKLGRRMFSHNVLVYLLNKLYLIRRFSHRKRWHYKKTALRINNKPTKRKQYNTHLYQKAVEFITCARAVRITVT